MAPVGPRRLRDLFDDSPTPHIAHPPSTHRRSYYVATDGSFSTDGGGLGVIIESRDGERVARIARPDDAPDNNTAEYRALHLGLDVLADRVPADARVGILVDHDDLAADVNAAVIAGRRPDYEPVSPYAVPGGAASHWRGIRARLAGFTSVRAARIDSRANPAHPLANAPEEFRHLSQDTDRCLLPEASKSDQEVPPPSRSDRGASD
ncbi:MAG: ribonuclease H [Halobacteriaceae archaeon]